MIGRLAFLAPVCLAVVACAGATPSGPGATGAAPSANGAPATESSAAASGPAATESPPAASDADGRYTLLFGMPKTSWSEGEDLTGTATLRVEPGPDIVLHGAYSLFLFEYSEVGGSRRISPASRTSCNEHPLAASAPLTSPLAKSGAWSDDMPDADLYRQFFSRPGVGLPAGDWDVAAQVSFSDGGDCGTGTSHDLRATVRIHIRPAGAAGAVPPSSPEPSGPLTRP
jgi:hypothetical protein